MAIPIVDLFAGPGGLGEGFSSLKNFQIVVSAEMESSAHATLRLRAFYRNLVKLGDNALEPYFALCNGVNEVPKNEIPHPDWDDKTTKAWVMACNEALQLTLGDPKCNDRLDLAIKSSGISSNTPWVLIGGPPCQAYSLVGRARNKGNTTYKPEEDHRHFLYKEYLRTINEYKPHVFVMENVKGILSSKIAGKKVFHNILKDLSSCGYNIYSLTTDTVFSHSDDPSKIDVRNFIVHSESFGIPQARHRVILLGIRHDICISKGDSWKPETLKKTKFVSVRDVISDLPRLRSKISKGKDSSDNWKNLLIKHANELSGEITKKNKSLSDIKAQLNVTKCFNNIPSEYNGSYSEYHKPTISSSNSLTEWYGSKAPKNLKFFLNHEARGHMESDLRRYLFAAIFAQVKGVSPKGHEDFDLTGLAPAHKNWESGKFSDRFRVQLAGSPATTITSHISKDGHYFIHYDPTQCRSLTVREAARLQTFPDDYFFQGNRTQQYHQVGNAVPPFLANQIAKIVKNIICE